MVEVLGVGDCGGFISHNLSIVGFVEPPGGTDFGFLSLTEPNPQRRHFWADKHDYFSLGGSRHVLIR